MVELEKVRTAQVLKSAQELANNSDRPENDNPNTSIILPAIEYASREARDDLRQMWSRLIANEYLGGGVHPEFPRILARLSADDALALASIGKESKDYAVRSAAEELHPLVEGKKEPLHGYTDEFCHHHLQKLGLIEQLGDIRMVNAFGGEFLKAVSSTMEEPSGHVIELDDEQILVIEDRRK